MLLIRQHGLWLALALALLLLHFNLVLVTLCLIVSVGLGVVAYLDWRLPDIEKDYELFRRHRIQTVRFLGQIEEDGFEHFVRKVIQSDKIQLCSKLEFNKPSTGYNGIDNQINSILQLIDRDYIQSWFVHISPVNLEFNHRFYSFTNHCISSLVKRCNKEGCIALKIFNRSIEELTKHLRIYRLTKNQLNYKLVTDDEFVSKFFENERKFDKNCSRQKPCTDPDSLEQLLSSILDILLFLLMPFDSFGNETFKMLAKEMVTKLLLLPLMQCFADPDFINNLMVTLFKTNTISTETFLAILQTIDNVDTLNVMLHSVDNELLNVRSKDSEDDDVKMKNQLGSLLYLKKILQSHLDRLKSLHRNSHPSNETPTKTKEDARHGSISFDTILNHNVALEYLIEYLASINCEHYLNFYLNVESFKISVEQGLLELYLDGLPEASNSSSESQFEQLHQLIYEAALNIYETYLAENAPNKLKLVDEKHCESLQQMLQQDCIDGSCSNPAWMNESLFDVLFFQVRDILLHHENFFPAFKRSKQFAKMVRAIDLIDDEVDGKSSPTSEKASLIADNIELKPAESDGFKIDIIETGILTEHGKTYVAYLLAVHKHKGDKWNTLRRYSEFASFHQVLLAKSKSHFDLKSILILPPKTVLRNRLNQTLIENRFNMLNLYVKKLNYLYDKFVFLREEINRFISPGPYLDPYYYYDDHGHKMEATNNNNANISNLLNPIRSIGNAVRNGSENLLDGIQKLGRSLSLQPSGALVSSPSFPSNVNSGVTSFVNEADTDSNCSEEENIPLLTLLDEIFELKHHNVWFRRRMIELFRQFIEATYSETINRKIIDCIDRWITPEAMQEYIKLLQNSFWQNGLLIESSASSKDEICRRQLAAKLLIVTLFPDLRKVIGNDTVERGLLSFLQVFQNQTINLRLLLVYLEIVLSEIFPANYFGQIFAHLYTQLDKQSNNSSSSSSSSWPPYLSAFISKI